MKTTLLWQIILWFILGIAAQAADPNTKAVQQAADENVAFFEKRYQTKIEGVKAMSEYSDPDEFYSEIARLLGIPKRAMDAAAKKNAWKPGDGKISKAIVKRAPGQWQVMIMRFALDAKTGKPDPKSLGMQMVTLDDDGKASFPPDETVKK